MNIDNTRDGAEPSSASDGSRPVLWALEWEEDAGRIDPEWVYGNREEAADVNETGCYGQATVVPLYRSPTLTDEERAAIALAKSRLGTSDGDWQADDVLAALLERLG